VSVRFSANPMLAPPALFNQTNQSVEDGHKHALDRQIKT